MQKKIIFLLLIICIGEILAAGCTSTESTNATPQVTTALPPTPTSSTAIITPQMGWETSTIPEDNFYINVPMTWTITENEAPTGSAYFLNRVNVENVKITPMRKILYLSSPDSNVNAIITGFEVYNLDGSDSINSDILPQFLSACIPAVEEAKMEGAPSKEIDGSLYNNIINGAKFESTVDPVLHKENGYNVMRAGINVADSNGDYIEYIEIFVLQSDNRIYFEQLDFINNAASDPTVQTEISTMLGSLTPTP
jgi:hypothetical protein